MKGLVLSLFPGIDILGMGFELEGWCVVRGPDVLWGGDVHRFHPPAGRFEGVIGGPPCQRFSAASRRWGGSNKANLIPQYERVVGEALPDWFVMENVVDAPHPNVTGYSVHTIILDNHWLGQIARRKRRFSFGTTSGTQFHVPGLALHPIESEAAVTASGLGSADFSLPHRGWQERARLQGVDPNEFDSSPFTQKGLGIMFGNAVPLPMARAIAKAIAKALERAA